MLFTKNQKVTVELPNEEVKQAYIINSANKENDKYFVMIKGRSASDCISTKYIK